MINKLMEIPYVNKVIYSILLFHSNNNNLLINQSMVYGHPFVLLVGTC